MRKRVESNLLITVPSGMSLKSIEIAELGGEFMQIYGLTETSPLLTINRRRAEEDGLPVPDRAKRLSRAGMPALGVRLRISDAGDALSDTRAHRDYCRARL